MMRNSVVFHNCMRRFQLCKPFLSLMLKCSISNFGLARSTECQVSNEIPAHFHISSHCMIQSLNSYGTTVDGLISRTSQRP